MARGRFPGLTAVVSAAVFLGALLGLGVACAQTAPVSPTLAFPTLSGRVVDEAGLLQPPARSAIEAKLAAHEAKTSDQFVVATVPSLQERVIEDFANQLFRHWRLGQAKTNNGVLLLVAPKERKVRIEVGYGLEGALTDAITKVIIAAAVTPKFKAGDFSGGIEAGVDAVISVLSKDSDEWQRRALAAQDSGLSDEVVTLIAFGVFIAIALLIVYGNLRSGARGRRWHRTRSGKWVALPDSSAGSAWGSGWSSGGSSGWSSGSDSGGFSGGGGSSGGGGASGEIGRAHV
jgi:uncharacterized protein